MIYYKYLMVDFIANGASILTISLAVMNSDIFKNILFFNGNSFIQNSFKKYSENINILNIIVIFKSFNFE